MKLAVLFGPEDGTAPTTEDEVDWLIVDRISLGCNGTREDVAMLSVDLDKAGVRLQDTTTPKGFKRQVEIRALDEDESPTRLLCWGWISRQLQQINSSTEAVRYEVRLDGSAYGDNFETVPFYDSVHGLMEVHRPGRHREFVFNPEIDDVIEGNMSAKTRENGDHAADGAAEFIPWKYPIDPESSRTTNAEFWQEAVSEWNLGDAILFLCNWLNPDETYITNPHTTAEIGLDAVDLADTKRIRNVAIPMGVKLPQALDALLIPLGYGWERQYSLGTSGERVTKLRFFKRGVGITKNLRMQRPGELINNRETNVADFGLEYSIIDLANKIEVYGNYIGIESTWDLVPTWSEADDALGLEELTKDHATAIEKPFVGRKWVLDTAGDYTTTRPELVDPYNLETLFGEKVPFRRRHFEKCLSVHSAAEDQESNGVRLDWYDWDATGAVDPDTPADPGWKKVTWPFSRLEKECGIIFNGATPPNELWKWFYKETPESTNDPTKARLRITATLRSDKRLKGEATRRVNSPNGLDLTLVIDARDKFEKLSVHADSIFTGGASIARDDTTKITEYAESIRNIEDCAQISCSITLDGADHPEYAIGDLIESVSGRNLALNAFDLESGDARYPQIMGFNYNFTDGQYTEVLLESFRQERPTV